MENLKKYRSESYYSERLSKNYGNELINKNISKYYKIIYIKKEKEWNIKY